MSMHAPNEARRKFDTQNDANCVGAADSTFNYVAANRSDAESRFGTFVPIQFGKSIFFVAEWATSDPERLVVEVMYRLLFEAANFNTKNVHGSVFFLNLNLRNNETFVAITGPREDPLPLSNMPTVTELVRSIHEQLGVPLDQMEIRRIREVLKENLPAAKFGK